jgi:hypothetical protein
LEWQYIEKFDQQLVADYSPYLDQWTHVALVRGEKPDNYMSMYLNGVLVEQCSQFEPVEQYLKSNALALNDEQAPNDAPIKATLYIGGYKGQIAEFCIWNQKARNQEQIRNDMFPPKDSKEEPTNYWPLDEVTDDGVVNNKSNPNNKGVFKGCNEPKIVDIEQSLSNKWVIKEEKNKFEELVYKKQTRFDIIPPQKDTARGEGRG